MNIESLQAIDVHTHVNRQAHTGRTHPPEGAVNTHFGSEHIKTLPEMVEMYRQQQIAFVSLMVDNIHRPPPVTNKEILPPGIQLTGSSR